MLEILELTKFDGRIQRLHYQFRSAFKHPEIVSTFSESVRRISLSKQFLFLMEPELVKEAFPLILGWVNFQVRKVVELSSNSVGINLTQKGQPFLLGFEPIGTLDHVQRFRSDEPPWTELLERHHNVKMQQLWDSRGSVGD